MVEDSYYDEVLVHNRLKEGRLCGLDILLHYLGLVRPARHDCCSPLDEGCYDVEEDYDDQRMEEVHDCLGADLYYNLDRCYGMVRRHCSLEEGLDCHSHPCCHLDYLL